MPAPKIIPPGTVFSKLTVIAMIGTSPTRKQVLYLCRCECGQFIEAVRAALVNDHTKSCGCYKIESARRRLLKHGATGTSGYYVLAGIIARCENPRNRQFADYGGRGIRICKGLRQFETFSRLMLPRPSDSHSVDRVNNNGHYSCGKCHECVANGWPMNLRWATRSEQANNTRVTTRLTLGEITQSVTAWSRELGLSKSTIKARLRGGWTVAEALLTPRINPAQPVKYDGRQKTPSGWAREVGLSRAAVYQRLNKGWSLDETLGLPPGAKTLHLITYQNDTRPLTTWARQFGIHPRTLYGRIQYGWSIHAALTTPTTRRKPKIGHSRKVE